jgi:hypothetical protein
MKTGFIGREIALPRSEIATNSCIAATLAMRLKPDQADKGADRL